MFATEGHTKAITDLKIEDESLRSQLESGEERLSQLRRLLDVEKRKLSDEESECAVSEARAAEV